MNLPTLEGFPHTDVPRGRLYRVNDHTDLAVFHVEAALPGAPAGFFVYAFVLAGRVGNWDWTADEQAIGRIAQSFRTATDPEYEPPDRRAPGGEAAQLRPPIENLVERAREAARPSSSPGSPQFTIPRIGPLRSDEG